MWKLLKLLPTVFVAAVLFVPYFDTNSVGLAAPVTLPNCGNDVVGGSSNSGWPDIATSQDANHYYTAIAWSEKASGTTPGQGRIKLAYAKADVTARAWLLNTGSGGVVDATSTNQNPVVTFDPVASNTVHIAYEREVQDGANFYSEIRYVKCTLGGSCGASELVSTAATSRQMTRRNSRLAVNSVNGVDVDVVVVYEEFLNGATPNTWLSYAYKKAGSSSFNRFEGGSGSGGTNRFGDSNHTEKAPTVAVSQNIMHVAYAEDTNNDGATDQIRYWPVDISSLPSSGAIGGATSSANNETFPVHPGAKTKEPNFPAIAALGSKLALVWQLKDPSADNGGTDDIFYLGYSFNDGVHGWDPDPTAEGPYNYIPSNTTAQNTNSPPVGDQILGKYSQLIDGLHPAVALHNDGSNDVIHVAWHQESPLSNQRTDVMYAYKKGSSAWAGTQILTGTAVGQVTNVTDFYGYSEKALDNTANISKLRPRLLFGTFGGSAHPNRLQMVYASYDGSARRVRYNGWQLGSDYVNPIRSEQDSDCDTFPDSEEMPVDYITPTLIITDVINDDPNIFYQNHDGNFRDSGNNIVPPGDYVPDFLDTNADGDFQADDVDDSRTQYSNDGAVFLPAILKKA